MLVTFVGIVAFGGEELVAYYHTIVGLRNGIYTYMRSFLVKVLDAIVSGRTRARDIGIGVLPPHT